MNRIKCFLENDQANHRKVTFHNRFGIILAADLYEPKKVVGKLPAIVDSEKIGIIGICGWGGIALNTVVGGVPVKIIKNV